MTDQELNEAVARKLGWKHEPDEGDCYIPSSWVNSDGERLPLPDYRHSIAAAWEIIEHVKKAHRRNVARLEWWDGFWACQLIVVPGEKDDLVGRADTAPMAICKAFLKLP